MQTPKRLSDYTPPAVEIRAVRLTVTFAEQVEVIGELTLAARPNATPGPYLLLDAEDLELLEVVVDGRTWRRTLTVTTASILRFPGRPPRSGPACDWILNATPAWKGFFLAAAAISLNASRKAFAA